MPRGMPLVTRAPPRPGVPFAAPPALTLLLLAVDVRVLRRAPARTSFRGAAHGPRPVRRPAVLRDRIGLTLGVCERENKIGGQPVSARARRVASTRQKSCWTPS